MDGSRLTSLTLGAFTLSLSLSPHAATPSPRPQEILHLSPHPQPLCSSAATCFRWGYVLSLGQYGSPSMVSGSMTLWWGWRGKVSTLPRTACRRGLGILFGSHPPWALTRDFRAWLWKSANPNTCDLQTPQRTHTCYVVRNLGKSPCYGLGTASFLGHDPGISSH